MSQLKTYTVAMIVSEVWDIIVEATSQEEAKAKAAAAHAGQATPSSPSGTTNRRVRDRE